LALGAGVGILSLGCEVPKAPEWEVSVTIPFTSDSLTTIDLLPSAVDTATIDGELVFVIDIQEDSILFRLGEMCEPCKLLHGDSATIPPFDYTDSLDVHFPEDVFDVQGIRARLELEIGSGLNFDPLRTHSDPDSAGSISLGVRDIATGALIRALEISGIGSDLPPSATWRMGLTLIVPDLTEGLRIILSMHSPPDTQVVVIDTLQTAKLKAKLDSIIVAGVTVVVNNKGFDDDDPLDVDVETRDELAKRYLNGTLDIQLNHNVEIDGTLDASLAATRENLFSGNPTREMRLQQLVLTPGIVQRQDVTPQELELLASFPDTFFIGYRGIARGTRQGPVGQRLSRITPHQFLRLRLRLHSRLVVGG
jgi:hypothetical protein